MQGQSLCVDFVGESKSNLHAFAISTKQKTITQNVHRSNVYIFSISVTRQKIGMQWRKCTIAIKKCTASIDHAGSRF
jgi:hypothetical protein